MNAFLFCLHLPSSLKLNLKPGEKFIIGILEECLQWYCPLCEINWRIVKVALRTPCTLNWRIGWQFLSQWKLCKSIMSLPPHGTHTQHQSTPSGRYIFVAFTVYLLFFLDFNVSSPTRARLFLSRDRPEYISTCVRSRYQEQLMG